MDGGPDIWQEYDWGMSCFIVSALNFTMASVQLSGWPKQNTSGVGRSGCPPLIQAQGIDRRAGALSAQGPDIQVLARIWAGVTRALSSLTDSTKAGGTEQVAKGREERSRAISHTFQITFQFNMSGLILLMTVVLAVLSARECSSIEASCGWLVFIL